MFEARQTVRPHHQQVGRERFGRGPDHAPGHPVLDLERDPNAVEKGRLHELPQLLGSLLANRRVIEGGRREVGHLAAVDHGVRNDVEHREQRVVAPRHRDRVAQGPRREVGEVGRAKDVLDLNSRGGHGTPPLLPGASAMPAASCCGAGRPAIATMRSRNNFGVDAEARKACAAGGLERHSKMGGIEACGMAHGLLQPAAGGPQMLRDLSQAEVTQILTKERMGRLSCY